MEQRLWQILETANEWVRYSDGKAVALLGIQGVLIGLALAFMKDSYVAVTSSSLMTMVFLAGILSLGA